MPGKIPTNPDGSIASLDDVVGFLDKRLPGDTAKIAEVAVDEQLDPLVRLIACLGAMEATATAGWLYLGAYSHDPRVRKAGQVARGLYSRFDNE